MHDDWLMQCSSCAKTHIIETAMIWKIRSISYLCKSQHPIETNDTYMSGTRSSYHFVDVMFYDFFVL